MSMSFFILVSLIARFFFVHSAHTHSIDSFVLLILIPFFLLAATAYAHSMRILSMNHMMGSVLFFLLLLLSCSSATPGAAQFPFHPFTYLLLKLSYKTILRRNVLNCKKRIGRKKLNDLIENHDIYSQKFFPVVFSGIYFFVYLIKIQREMKCLMEKKRDRKHSINAFDTLA